MPITYTYQWLRCEADGTLPVAIGGATAMTYVPVTADVGKTLRVSVTGTNNFGSTTVVSSPTAVILVAGSPPPPPDPGGDGTAEWVGDFETGNFSQFDDSTQGLQNAVVTDASSHGGPSSARRGTHFYQSEVHSGDNIAGGERCEIIKGGLQAANGVEKWYSFSWALPSSFPSGNSSVGGTLLGQFHSNSDQPSASQANIQIATSPNFAGVNYSHTYADPGLVVGINGGDPTQNGQYYNINGQTNGLNGHPYTSFAFDLGALSSYKNVGWIDWAFHIIWSDSGAGLVEVYQRMPGAGSYSRVAQLLNCSNMYRGYSAYLKLGQNRKQSSGLPIGYVWFDEARKGTTLASVTP